MSRGWRVTLAGAGLVVACRAHAGQTAALPCDPTAESLPVTARAAGLVGEYHLVLIADRGSKPGKAEGRLWLRPQPPALRQQTGGQMPLIGGTDASVDQVGALRLGDLASSDSTRPGVAVLQQSGQSTNSIILRLGSDANRLGVVRFDGGFTALTVTSVTGAGFRGTWASGVTGVEASGYFCATRDSRSG